LSSGVWKKSRSSSMPKMWLPMPIATVFVTLSSPSGLPRAVAYTCIDWQGDAK
jgi:hypothetical protein